MQTTFIYNGESWWVKISDPQELLDYFNIEWKRRADKAKAEYERTQGGKLYHYSDHLANMCDIMRRQNFISFDEQLDNLRHETFKEMYHALCDEKNVFINSKGGYNFEQEIRKELKKDNFDFPVFSMNDIHIKKWPGGNHYYAYAGNKQITNGDVVKWNTQKEAEEAAMKYLDLHKEG